MLALPAALAPLSAYRQFIVYTVSPSPTRPGKTDKFPCDFRTGRVVGAHDPAVWTDAPTAIAAAATLGPAYGVGFVLTDHDPFFCLDVDGAYDPATGWSAVANWAMQSFPGAAVEVSQSGKGLHIFGRYSHVPPHKTKAGQFGLELYHNGRFIALTGSHAQGSADVDFTAVLSSVIASTFPPDAADLHGSDGWTTGPCAAWRGPEDDDKLIERALRSSSAAAAFGNKASFFDLWNADVDKLARCYPDNGGSAPYDQSQADSALAQHLAFWTGKDCERIERLMRRSGLVRDKWEREDYLPRTIMKVCARQVDVLTDKELAPPPEMGSVAPGVTPAASSAPVAVQGSTWASVEQQMAMFKGCVYVMDQNRALVKGGNILKESQFKVLFGGYTFMMDNANERTSRDAWEAFTQNQAFRCPMADSAAFLPQHEPGAIVQLSGKTVVNTYWPVNVVRKVGDPTPFLRHLAKILPDERDRQILLAYMAAIVQHKGVKFQWAPVIQGCEGNGKTLLSRTVAYAVGDRYSYWPKAGQLDSNFNDWMLGNIFIGVEDIHVPGERSDIMEAIKPMVTGDEQEIEGKGKDKVKSFVCGNWILNGNRKDLMPVTDNSRRWALFFCAQQSKADLARDGMDGDYFPNLYNWMRAEGYAIVAELLHTYPIPDELNPATMCQRAPDTSSKAEAVAQSRGTIEQEVIEAVEQGLPGFAGGWISSIYLGKLIEGMGGRRLSHIKRRELLASLGYEPHPGLTDGRVDSIVLPDGGKPRLFVKPGHPAAFLSGASAIARAYSAAQEVKAPSPV